MLACSGRRSKGCTSATPHAGELLVQLAVQVMSGRRTILKLCLAQSAQASLVSLQASEQRGASSVAEGVRGPHSSHRSSGSSCACRCASGASSCTYPYGRVPPAASTHNCQSEDASTARARSSPRRDHLGYGSRESCLLALIECRAVTATV